MLLRTYRDKFEKTGNLKDFLAYFSVETWTKLQLNRKNPKIHRLREETFTDKLVSKAFLIVEKIFENMSRPISIRMFHAINEKANGNDIEILIPINKKNYILFPCQCKRIFPNDKYDQITHKNGKQINSLIEYANQNGGYPLYCFYNFTETPIQLPSNISHKELYGCTIISAKYILDKIKVDDKYKIISFKDIHPPAQPIFILADYCDKNNAQELLPIIDKDLKISDLKIYTENDLKKTDYWVEINPQAGHKFVSSQKPFWSILEENASEHTIFNPKFRIILSTQIIYERQYNYESL